MIVLSCCMLANCSDAGSDIEGNAAEPLGTSALSQPPAAPTVAAYPASDAGLRTEVPLEEDGGTFVIPVTVNNTISLRFTIDSGAADVTIPSDVASTLVRAGTISPSDYVGSQTFTLADGSEVPSPEFRIRSLRVGNVLLHDVIASITGTSGSLLLGQTFLKRLKSWSIDNQRHVLLIETEPGADIPSSSATQAIASTAQPPIADVSDAAAAALAASSEETVKQYFAAWSDPSDPDGDGARQYYGDSVEYYGKVVSAEDLVSGEKLRFARRWPVRSYTVRPKSMETRCSADARKCTIVGIIDFKVSSPARLRDSSGAARFSMVVEGGQIVGEGGRVLSRDVAR